MHARITSLVGLLLVVGSVAAEAQLPDAPRNLMFSRRGSEATFTWLRPLAGVTPTSYELEIVPLGSLGSRTDVGLVLEVIQVLDDGVYTARVRAMNGDLAGPPSNDVTFTIAPPKPPQNVQVVVSGNAATFSWQLPTTGPPEVGYQLEIGIPGLEVPPAGTAAPPTRLVTIADGNSTSWTELNLANAIYVARMRGVTLDGDQIIFSAPSNELAFIVGPPPSGPVPFPPTDLRVEGRAGVITLFWNLRNDSPAVSRYRIYASVGSPSVFLGAFDTPTAQRQISFRNVPTGNYTVYVEARNANGPSQRPSNTITFGVNQGNTCLNTLDPPTSLSHTNVGNFVALTWARPAVAPDLRSYRIQAGSAPGLSNLADFSTNNVDTLIAGTVPSGTYYVRVRGEDSCQQGAASNEILVIVP